MKSIEKRVISVLLAFILAFGLLGNMTVFAFGEEGTEEAPVILNEEPESIDLDSDLTDEAIVKALEADESFFYLDEELDIATLAAGSNLPVEPLIAPPSCLIVSTNTGYLTLEAALAAVAPGDTIKLLQDIQESITIIVDDKLTIDMGGFNLSLNYIEVTSSGNLTIQNGGTLSLGVSQLFVSINVTGGKLTIQANIQTGLLASTVVLANSGSEVNLTGTINCEQSGVVSSDSGTKVTVNGNIYINGSIGNAIGARATHGGSLTVNGNIYADGYGLTGAASENGGQVTINGVILSTSYIKFLDSTLGSTSTTISQHEPTSTKPGYREYTDGNNNFVWVAGTAEFICEIGSTQYKTLSDALAAAVDGNTIKFLCDITEATWIGVGRSALGHTLDELIIDMNGFDLDIGDNLITVSSGGELTILNGGTITNNRRVVPGGTLGLVRVNGGKLTAQANIAGTSAPSPGIYADGGAEVNFAGNINALSGMTVTDSGSQVTFTGNINVSDSAYFGALGLSATSGGSITANGSIVASGTNAIGAYAGYGGKIIVNGTISAPNYISFYSPALGSTSKTAAEHEPTSSKLGYLEYTDDSENFVWVLDPNAPVTYSVTKHFDDFTGSGTSKAIVDADHTKFQHLLYQGAQVNPSNYTITQGSTVITLSEVHLKTLAAGTHTFTAVFSDGTSEAIQLVVTSSAGTTGGGTVPQTADISLLPLLFCALTAFIGAASVFAARKLKRKETF
ncbi:MAG: hypothetical protein FWE41_01040 [Coriobacteriia bacterium]|nr:hypothetical protein [Coriobacteriia bacterium]MCL2750547.1 hypothetical protein [Coriobacteriia bacterium]